MEKSTRTRPLLRAMLSLLIASTMVFAVAPAFEQKAYANPTAPTAVNGRILTPQDTGDKVNWVEIARYGNYSLIVRSSYLNWYSQASRYGNSAWQYMSYPASSGVARYSTSTVRTYINKWFNGTAYACADNLPANARLRSYTMQNNAMTALGTASTLASQTNGFSTPYTTQVRYGDDIAFALSFSEAMNFMSLKYDQRGRNPQITPSSAIAQSNFAKISIPQEWEYGAWLRSPGDYTGTAGAVDYTGRVFQFWGDTNGGLEKGMLYPALWVDQGIFAPAIGTVNVVCKDANTGAILQSNSYEINTNLTNSYGPYNAPSFRFYLAGVLDPSSDPIQGTIAQGQTKTITYLYTRGQALLYILRQEASGNPISYTTLFVPAGEYSYNQLQLPGYMYLGLASNSDPLTGVVDVNHTKVIVLNYMRAAG